MRDKYIKFNRLMRLDFNKKLTNFFKIFIFSFYSLYLIAVKLPKNGLISLVINNCMNKALDKAVI